MAAQKEEQKEQTIYSILQAHASDAMRVVTPSYQAFYDAIDRRLGSPEASHTAYLALFKLKRAYSCDLRDPKILRSYVDRGYHWIRPLYPDNIRHITRTPTVGRMLELSIMERFGYVRIDSTQAHRLIHRLCYF